MIAQASCEEASRLASESQDRELTWKQRWALRVHLLLCGSCRRMMRQLESLRALMAHMPDTAQQELRTKLPQLSADRKLQIKQLLADADHAGHD
jgi:hypothetical protein